mmetsp:Transcript_14038/g.60129  ORF Transcript_14038/g.60129 Transcript_14038/m.60129 type:complete len:223 (-) Transcript_14038:72-740(-)
MTSRATNGAAPSREPASPFAARNSRRTPRSLFSARLRTMTRRPACAKRSSASRRLGQSSADNGLNVGSNVENAFSFSSSFPRSEEEDTSYLAPNAAGSPAARRAIAVDASTYRRDASRARRRRVAAFSSSAVRFASPTATHSVHSLLFSNRRTLSNSRSNKCAFTSGSSSGSSRAAMVSSSLRERNVAAANNPRSAATPPTSRASSSSTAFGRDLTSLAASS